VTLVKSPPGEACLHDDVTFTCTSDTGLLTWTQSAGQNSIIITSDTASGFHFILGSIFNVTVISNDPIESTASLIGGANSNKNGINITCSDGVNGSMKSQVKIAGIQSPNVYNECYILVAFKF